MAMTVPPEPQDNENTFRLQALRDALAANRAMEFLADMAKGEGATIQHNETSRFNYLFNLYLDIKTKIYKDWGPGKIQPAADVSRTSEEVRRAMGLLCSNGETVREADGKTIKDAPSRKLFNRSGSAITHSKEELASILGNFYTQMREINPGKRKNDIALDLFMVALLKLPAFNDVYDGLDFRRLAPAEAVLLHDVRSSRSDVAQVFLHALDRSLTPKLNNPPADEFKVWESHKTFIGEIPFLSHESAQFGSCLVTVNGGLVPLDSKKEAEDETLRQKLEKDIVSGHPLIDFAHISEDQIVGYLPGKKIEDLKGRTQIDSMEVTPEKIPLFCLDTDILTGLRDPDKKSLQALIAQRKDGSSIFNLNNREEADRSGEIFRNELIAAAKARGDARLERTVEIAYEHVNRSVKKLDDIKHQILKGKTPDEHPQFFMSMGGAGSGKTSVRNIAAARTGGNYIEASLDNFRYESDLYNVLVAANHHADDYQVISPFATTLRDWVANGAGEQGYNVFYDGTGIDYEGRYDKIVKDFKKAGYKTLVGGVDTPLAVAWERVVGRFDEEKRALPWPVTNGKHINMARSFLHAAEDSNLDKIWLTAADNGHATNYLVAESFILTNDEVATLRERQKSGGLAKHLKGMVKDQSILNDIARSDGTSVNEHIERIPNFKENNVAYLVYPQANKNRVVAIYNTERFKDLMEKGLKNPQASYKEGFDVIPKGAPFLSPGWTERTQAASKSNRER